MVTHIPVLLELVLETLQPRLGQNFIDATYGGGGHAAAIVERLGPTGRLFVFDVDPAAVVNARALGPNVQGFAANFRSLAETIRYVAPDCPIHGIVFDLGVSSAQLADPQLGLSFQEPGALRMRLDRGPGMTAAVIVNSWPEGELTKLIQKYGEERWAHRIARAIVRRRRDERFTVTTDLAAVVAAAIPGRRGKIHPATRTFQALRIAVNDELGSLAAGLSGALSLLTAGGRVAVISFHSLEDRVVKQTFREAARQGRGTVLIKKPAVASAAERAVNPRSRSAKLRAFEKIA